MELDFVVAYVALAAALFLTLTLASIPSLGHNLQEFLTQVAVAASHPGTVLRTRLVLPEGVEVATDVHAVSPGSPRQTIVVVRGAAIPPSVARLYEELGLGELRERDLWVNFTLAMPRLTGGYIYTLRIASTPGRVTVEVVSVRKLPD